MFQNLYGGSMLFRLVKLELKKLKLISMQGEITTVEKRPHTMLRLF